MRGYSHFLLSTLLLVATMQALTIVPISRSILYETREVRGNNWQWLTIEKNELENPNLFRFVEQGEFRYNGEMFDYTNSEKTETGMRFWGRFDKLESWLLKQTEKSQSKNNTQQKLLIEKWYTSLYVSKSIDLAEMFIPVLSHQCAVNCYTPNAFLTKIEKPPAVRFVK